MEVIIKQKGGGKTTELIKMSAKNKDCIVCRDELEVSRILKEAKQMKLDIPRPISYYKFLQISYSADYEIVQDIKGFLFDNVDAFLKNLTIVPIKAITLTM